MADSLMRIIISATDKASGTLKNVGKAAKGMEGEVKGAGKGIDLSLGTITAGLAAITTAVVAVKKVWEFGKEGAAVGRLETATTSLASTYGSSMRKIVSSIQEASLGTISSYDAMKSAGAAMMLGLGADSEKLANLMEVAALRGRAMGVDTSQAFNDIVRGIGRMSPLILDNLGIMIDSEKVYKEYAASIGKATSELTQMEKKQALLNSVLAEGNIMLGEAGGLTADLATGYERVAARWEDVTNGFKKGMALSQAKYLLTEKERAQLYQEEAQSLILQVDTYEDLVTQQKYLQRIMEIKGQPITSQFVFTEANYFKDLAEAYGDIKPKVASVAKTTETYNDELYYQLGLMGDISKAQETFGKAMADAKRDTEQQELAIQNLGESYEDFILGSLSKLGIGPEASMQVAYAFGEIDDKSIAVFGAISKLTEMFNNNEISAEFLAESLMNVKNNINLLDNVALQDKTMTIRINVLVNGIQAGFGGDYLTGGLIPNILGAGAGSGPSYFKAKGGPVQMGQPYIVGERGPEMFVPNASGNILPNDKMGGNNTFKFYDKVSFVIPKDGISAADLMRQMGVA